MNFALILFLLTVLTGVITLADRMAFARGRRQGAPEPWWIEYPKSFFPVLLIVFLLRSFVAGPVKIQSSSMRPTPEVGRFILDLLIEILDQLAAQIPGCRDSEKNECGCRHRRAPERDPPAKSSRSHPAPRCE